MYYIQHLELHFFSFFKTHFTKERTFKVISYEQCIVHVCENALCCPYTFDVTPHRLEATSRTGITVEAINPRHITDSFQIKTRMPLALHHRLTITYHSLCTKKRLHCELGQAWTFHRSIYKCVCVYARARARM